MGGPGGWTDRDRLLVHAWTLYRASLCPECGYPRDLCESATWEVNTRVCRPTAVVEQWRKENKEPPPGTRVSPRKVEEEEYAEELKRAPRWWLEKFRPDLLEKYGGVED